MRLTRMLVISALLFSSPSCGPIPVNRNIDPEFVPLFLTFLASAAQHAMNISRELSDNLTIKFETLPYSDGSFGTIVGYCSFPTGSPIVQVDRKFWGEVDAYTRESLVFHELGHCLLLRQHTSAHPSLMRAMLVDSRQFNEYTSDYFLSELFKI